MPPWDAIDHILLDMDGTLLDLHFDNRFWREHVPARYAEKHDLSLAAAKAALYPRFRRVEGTMDWYCVEYWTRELGLPIAELKRELSHLISVRPLVPEFLAAARAAGRRTVLVTNAHHKSLGLKLELTALHNELDTVICSHDYGRPKEDAGFWAWLGGREPFAPERTLLIDDSLPVLRSARGYGIRHLLAVRHPDSREPGRDTVEFEAVDSFQNLIDGLEDTRIPARGA